MTTDHERHQQLRDDITAQTEQDAFAAAIRVSLTKPAWPATDTEQARSRLALARKHNTW